jgi:hypothetical protein
LLLTVAIRATFLKPLFLLLTLVRFHTLIENQPINIYWSHYRDGLTPNFGKEAAATFVSNCKAPYIHSPACIE